MDGLEDERERKEEGDRDRGSTRRAAFSARDDKTTTTDGHGVQDGTRTCLPADGEDTAHVVDGEQKSRRSVPWTAGLEEADAPFAAATAAPTESLTWPEFFALRKRQRRLAVFSSIPTTALGLSLGVSYFASQEVATSETTIFGIPTIYAFAFPPFRCQTRSLSEIITGMALGPSAAPCSAGSSGRPLATCSSD